MRAYFGPAYPYIFRLVGPGKTRTAWSLIESAQARIHPSPEEVRKENERRRQRKEFLKLGAFVVVMMIIYGGCWAYILFATYQLTAELLRDIKGLCKYLFRLIFNWCYEYCICLQFFYLKSHIFHVFRVVWEPRHNFLWTAIFSFKSVYTNCPVVSVTVVAVTVVAVGVYK